MLKICLNARSDEEFRYHILVKSKNPLNFKRGNFKEKYGGSKIEILTKDFWAWSDKNRMVYNSEKGYPLLTLQIHGREKMKKTQTYRDKNKSCNICVRRGTNENY